MRYYAPDTREKVLTVQTVAVTVITVGCNDGGAGPMWSRITEPQFLPL